MITKPKSGNKTAQQLINVEAIQNDILWTQDQYLFSFIRVKGDDNSLLSSPENESLTEQITVTLSEQVDPYQIISIPRTVDTRGMIASLRQLRQDTENTARLQLIDMEISTLDELAQNGAKEPMILVKLWKKAEKGADKLLLERTSRLVQKLCDCKISAEVMQSSEIRHMCSIYAELGIWQNTDVQTDIPYLSGKKRKFSRKATPEEIAHCELLEEITPIGGVFFHPTDLVIGSSFCRCYGATLYPAEIEYGWAVSLMCATDCITCITYVPDKSGVIGDALSRSARTAKRDAEEESDLRRKKKLERSARDADRLIDDLDAHSMSLGTISVVTMPFGSSMEDLEHVCKEVLSRYSLKRIKLKILSYLQKEAFLHLSPYYPAQDIIQSVVGRVIPLETFLGGYPMTVNTLRDDHGIRFARTLDRGMIALDIRHRAHDRTNGNGIVTGIAGTGKSTMLKHLLESMYMLGLHVIVIDPEREFKELCHNLDGTWLNAAGGEARINLLQIQAQVMDNDEQAPDSSAHSKKLSPLTEHIQYVETVLSYKIPSLTDIQMALTERTLLKLYEQFGITMDTTWEELKDLEPTKYPVMHDLYTLTLEQAQTDKRYEDIALLMESMALGADSIIWNGHTNIDLSNAMVVIDTKQLCNSTQRNQAAQYYSLMRQIFSVVSADRHTPYMVIADEAQTMLDPNLPSAAEGLKNMSLRFRKYEGYLWLAFHSLFEVLNEQVRRYGQPIIDTPTYKILFGTDGRNLADTVELFHLTPAEEKLLNARRRGKALALIGNQHLKVEFDIPKYKLSLMGSGGGR